MEPISTDALQALVHELRGELRQTAEQQMQQMQQMHESTTAALRDDMNRMRTDYEQSLRSLRVASSNSPGPGVPSVATPDTELLGHRAFIGSQPEVLALRKQAPWPDKFSGERAKFPSWRTSMEHKLRRDTAFIGTEEDKFFAIYERLEGTAQRTADPYFRAGGPQGDYNPTAFLDFLSSHYDDPNRPRRAAQELRAYRQKGTQPFTSFFSVWERLLAEAGGAIWPDEAKLVILEGAINYQLAQALVPVTMPHDYQGWVRKAMEVSAKLDGLSNHRAAPARGPTVRPPATPTRGAVNVQDSDGDTPMAGVSTIDARAAPRRRAKWVTQEEMDRRRAEGRCLRCGKSDCRINRCPLAPARRPTIRVQTVAEPLESDEYPDDENEGLKE